MPEPSPGSRWLARIENTTLAVALCGIVVVVLLQIGSRTILGDPLSWSTEVATGLLIWSAFLGFAVAVRERAHVALTVVEEHLSGRVRYAVHLAQLVVFAFLLGALTYGGARLMIGEFGAVSAVGIPRWIEFAAVPVGSGLALLHVVAQAYTLRAEEPDGGRDGRPVETVEGAL